MGLARNPTERRMALRLSQQRQARARDEQATPEAEVVQLSSVRAVLEPLADQRPDPGATAGDDDGDEELEAAAPDEALHREVSDTEFYADAFESLG